MYCIYRHIRKDLNTPFYIGRATGIEYNNGLLYYARAYKKDQRTKEWFAVVNSSEYTVDVLYETDSLEEVCEKEIEFIKMYGRVDLGTGSLVNLTDGGYGVGGNIALQTIKKLSDQKIGHKLNVGRIHSKEFSERLSILKKGNKNFLGKSHSEEAKNKIRDLLKGKPKTEAHRLATIGTRTNCTQILCVTNGVTYNSVCECIRLLFNCHGKACDKDFLAAKAGIMRSIRFNVSGSYKGFVFKKIK